MRDWGWGLTTATNCELAGNLSWKLTEESSPENCWDTIVRTSMLFASGVGPYGMIRTLYGGAPEPEI